MSCGVSRRGRRSVFCAIESLELRQLLATITVTSNADSITRNDGAVTLREAITSLNAANNLGDADIIAQNPGPFFTDDMIHFNIPGTGVQTIHVGGDATAPNLPLPAI